MRALTPLIASINDLGLPSGSNEVEAREGIDTKASLMASYDTLLVAMRLKPVRALIHSPVITFVIIEKFVAMRLKPVRALTLVMSTILLDMWTVAMRLKPVRALTPIIIRVSVELCHM